MVSRTYLVAPRSGDSGDYNSSWSNGPVIYLSALSRKTSLLFSCDGRGRGTDQSRLLYAIGGDCTTVYYECWGMAPLYFLDFVHNRRLFKVVMHCLAQASSRSCNSSIMSFHRSSYLSKFPLSCSLDRELFHLSFWSLCWRSFFSRTFYRSPPRPAFSHGIV